MAAESWTALRALGEAGTFADDSSLFLARSERTELLGSARGWQLSEPLVPGLPYSARICYGVAEEMAKTLSDLLIRRTHLAFETRDHGVSVAANAAEIVAPLLGWDDQRKGPSPRVQAGRRAHVRDQLIDRAIEP